MEIEWMWIRVMKKFLLVVPNILLIDNMFVLHINIRHAWNYESRTDKILYIYIGGGWNAAVDFAVSDAPSVWHSFGNWKFMEIQC